MIEPTVGRVVLFRPTDGDMQIVCERNGRVPAIITKVWSPRCVNLAIFDAHGVAHARTSVMLYQPEDTIDLSMMFCEWMPYQIKKPTGSESGEKAAGTQVV